MTISSTRWRFVRIRRDRKSTRLNSSHANISYAVFCLKKKKNKSPLNQTNLKSTSHHLYLSVACTTTAHLLITLINPPTHRLVNDKFITAQQYRRRNQA